MKKSLLLILITLVCFSAFPQGTDFILLKRGTNQKSQIRFYPGEEITYKSSKLGYFTTDVIVDLDQNFIYMRENIIAPKDILEVDIRRKDARNITLRNINALLLGSGALLFSVEAINGLYQRKEFSIDNGVALISGILVGTGLALLPLRYKTFKQKDRNKIQIILMRMD